MHEHEAATGKQSSPCIHVANGERGREGDADAGSSLMDVCALCGSKFERSPVARVHSVYDMSTTCRREMSFKFAVLLARWLAGSICAAWVGELKQGKRVLFHGN